MKNKVENKKKAGKRIQWLKSFGFFLSLRVYFRSDEVPLLTFFHVISVRYSDWLKNECKHGSKELTKTKAIFFALKKKRSCSLSYLPGLNFQAFVVWLDTVMANAVNGGSHSSIESLNGELYKHTKSRFSRVNLWLASKHLTRVWHWDFLYFCRVVGKAWRFI